MHAELIHLLMRRTRPVELRDENCRKLAAEGVPCTPFYPHTLYQNELYRQGGWRATACPVAEECVRDTFWLPHRVLLAEAVVVNRIAGIIRGAARRAVEVRPGTTVANWLGNLKLRIVLVDQPEFL